MFATNRVRIAAAALTVALLSGGIAAAVTSTASASPQPKSIATSAKVAASPAWKKHHHPKPKLSLTTFDLKGYVINAKYTLGRNTGNTFQQTYQGSTVLGVPIAGPNVGVKFPTESYVAVPIGNHELYVTWLDPSTDAIVDVFVMNFRTHTVYDFAPGSTTPQSAGTIKVVGRGPHQLP